MGPDRWIVNPGALKPCAWPIFAAGSLQDVFSMEHKKRDFPCWGCLHATKNIMCRGTRIPFPSTRLGIPFQDCFAVPCSNMCSHLLAGRDPGRSMNLGATPESQGLQLLNGTLPIESDWVCLFPVPISGLDMLLVIVCSFFLYLVVSFFVCFFLSLFVCLLVCLLACLFACLLV